VINKINRYDVSISGPRFICWPYSPFICSYREPAKLGATQLNLFHQALSLNSHSLGPYALVDAELCSNQQVKISRFLSPGFQNFQLRGLADVGHSEKLQRLAKVSVTRFDEAFNFARLYPDDTSSRSAPKARTELSTLMVKFLSFEHWNP
jgi:hypothetical protein